MSPFGTASPATPAATSSLSSEDSRLLVQSIGDYAVFMLDPDGHVVTWNLGGERIKGFKAAEVIGKHFSSFYPPEAIDAGKPERELRVATEHGRVEDEGWRLRKDGSRFWANVVITALRCPDGTLRGFATVTRDLTQQRAAEAELRRSEQRFHHLVDAVTDYAIFMLDPTARVATWNAGARRIKGYEEKEIVGSHFSVFYTPEDRASGKPERILETIHRDGRYEEEGWRVRKDGSLFWANVVITALRDEKGSLLGYAKVTRDLTERVRANEDLRQSEERFRLLVEGIDDYALYMLDTSGLVSTWNAGAEKITGYDSGSIIGKHFSVFFTDEQRRASAPERELTGAATDGRFEEESWRVREDGSRFWANVVVTALRNPSGELIGFANVTRDLTAARTAEETARELIREQTRRLLAEETEERLREERERYKALSRRFEVILEGVDDGITLRDRGGHLLFANGAALRTCGFSSVEDFAAASPAEIVERFELRDEEGVPLSDEELPGRRVLAGAESANATVRQRDRHTQRESWLSIRARGISSPDGKPDLVVNIWHDVSAERRREEHERYLARATVALSTSLDYEETLSTVVALLVPGLADFAFIDVVEGVEVRRIAAAHPDPELDALIKRMTSTPSEQRIKGFSSRPTGEAALYPHVDDASMRDMAESPEHLELLRRLQLGSFATVPLRARGALLGSLTVCFGESGRRHTLEDLKLTEELARRAGTAIMQARLYEQAQAAARRAEEASRIKDEFLATVSHELRTPLNAIVGWSSLLRERSTDPSATKGIDVIHRNALAQGKIIEDILEVSRIITGKLRLELMTADLAATTRDAIEVVRPSANAKGIAIDLDVPSVPCALLADPERLQQVAWNLLSNAVKFTGSGGRVAVAVRQDNASVVLSVSDTGSGIDPVFLPYVFDRFKQADSSTTRRVGGLGLGLAIVRHIVELHGGQVHAASAGLGRGATFTITLPVRAMVPALQEAGKPSLVPSPRASALFNTSLSGLRVLVVDDDPDARDLIETLVHAAGAAVETAASSSEAFDRVQRFRPHVVVSDIGMPEEDGYGLMRRIRALDPRLGGGIPSIALTAYARAEDRTKALSAGFTTHIGKPVTPDELLAAIQSVARAPAHASV